MSIARWATPLGLSLSLAACAIHPLPEDVAGVTTAQIVHRIRCEAREAVIKARSMIAAEPGDTSQKMKRRQAKLTTLDAIGIVYSFTLNGQEMDNLNSTTGATFVKPLSNGSFTLNPSVGDTLMRQNIRSFTVIDNFSAVRSNQRVCDDQVNAPNYQYPIAGHIGVAEMINTFVTLVVDNNLQEEQSDNLALGQTAPAPALNTAPAMVDTISFTTTLSAGLTSTWMLTPIGNALQLSGASLNLGAQRMDVHQVIIGLALPGPVSSLGQVAAPSQPLFAGGDYQRSRLLVPGYPRRDNGEAEALQAVSNQIARFEVPKSLIIAP
jgi:hypothetical protein